ncbi:MAG TPA: hypothetical protein VN758_00590 [Solirubrobacterales bacterium]|nr:hypothetical protein [Solirubrobacterales bacterium]
MSTFVRPGETRAVSIGPLDAGLAGSIGVRVEDATNQVLRARSTAGVTEFAVGWYRVSVLFEEDWSGPVVVIADAPDGREGIEEFEVVERLPIPTVGWRPTTADVAAAIRSRTYTNDKGGETEDPLDDVVGGAVAGDFTTATSPTGEQIEGHITDACIDVLTHFASGVVPEDSEDAARRAATLKAALAVEISSFNASSAEQSPYLQLRIDADQAMNSLIATAQTRDLFAEERPE